MNAENPGKTQLTDRSADRPDADRRSPDAPDGDRPRADRPHADQETADEPRPGGRKARDRKPRDRTAHDRTADRKRGDRPRPVVSPPRRDPDAAVGGRPGVTRRRLLGTAGAAGAAGLVVGGAGGVFGAEAARDDPTALTSVGAAGVPFHGAHQAGIVDPAQASGRLAAFDLAAGADRKSAAALLRRWSQAAERMTAGRSPGADDDQVALDAGPSSLTVTFGFGRSFFARTGLAARLPAALDPLPDFAGDALDKARSDGDLWVQIGSNDPLVAFHALRVLQRTAQGAATVRWQLNGFNRAPGATAVPRTGRNLMGQIDGTNNPKPSDADFDQRIFVPARGTSRSPEWMAGGSYAVVRRIRMLLDSWDDLSVSRQEKVVGRRKSDGAPLSGGTETTPVRLDQFDAHGTPAIAPDAHIRVAAPASNDGAAMLRRAFSYHDGIGADGTPDAGLLFVAWQADPLRGFIPVQRKLDGGDGLSRFLRHEASGLFAVPGGIAPGEYAGQRLLES